MANTPLQEEINAIYPVGSDPDSYASENEQLQQMAVQINNLRAQGGAGIAEADILEKSLRDHLQISKNLNHTEKKAGATAFLKSIAPQKPNWQSASSYNQKPTYWERAKTAFGFSSNKKVDFTKNTPNAKKPIDKSKWENPIKEEAALKKTVADTKNAYKNAANYMSRYNKRYGHSNHMERSVRIGHVSRTATAYEKATEKLNNFFGRQKADQNAHKAKFSSVMDQLKTNPIKLKKVEINAHKKTFGTKIKERMSETFKSINATKRFKAVVTALREKYSKSQVVTQTFSAINKTASTGIKAVGKKVASVGKKIAETVQSMRSKR